MGCPISKFVYVEEHPPNQAKVYGATPPFVLEYPSHTALVVTNDLT